MPSPAPTPSPSFAPTPTPTSLKPTLSPTSSPTHIGHASVVLLGFTRTFFHPQETRAFRSATALALDVPFGNINKNLDVEPYDGGQWLLGSVAQWLLGSVGASPGGSGVIVQFSVTTTASDESLNILWKNATKPDGQFLKDLKKQSEQFKTIKRVEGGNFSSTPFPTRSPSASPTIPTAAPTYPVPPLIKLFGKDATSKVIAVGTGVVVLCVICTIVSRRVRKDRYRKDFGRDHAVAMDHKRAIDRVAQLGTRRKSSLLFWRRQGARYGATGGGLLSDSETEGGGRISSDRSPLSPSSSSELGTTPNILSLIQLRKMRGVHNKGLFRRLQEGELHNHVARVYLAGDNSWASPWELHLTQPLPGDMEIALLGLTRLRAFRDGCNEACVVPWWERYVHALLAVVCLPAAAAFLRARKGGRAVALRRFVATSDHSFLQLKASRGGVTSPAPGGNGGGGAPLRSRDASARVVHRIALGDAGDYSLAYLDFIAGERSGRGRRGNGRDERGLALAAGRRSASPDGGVDAGAGGGPTLPLVLLVSGAGDYSHPFHVDVQDAMVRAVPRLSTREFIDEAWVEFVDGLNAELRAVRAREMGPTIRPVLRYLRGRGRGQHRLGGLRVRLGRFLPCGGRSKGRV